MITDVRTRVYSDAECQHLVTTVTSPSVDLVQDFELIGLQPATTYWAVGVVQDEQHVEVVSAPYEFTTLAYTINITGTIGYWDRWDRLVWTETATAPQGVTINQMGIELSLVPDFSEIAISRTFDPNQTNQIIEPVLEHTLYYVRYWARTNSVTQYWTDPEDNTILTRWAPPVIGVTADNITTNSMRITVTYTGNYPVDYNSLVCVISPQSWSGQSWNVPLERLAPGTPEHITLSGLPSNGTLYVEVVMDYYEDEVYGQGTFTTAQAETHYVFDGTVENYRTETNIYPTSMRSSCTVSLRNEEERVTWKSCGIEFAADEEFTTHVITLTRNNTNRWSNVRTNGFNEHKLYYYRFWGETDEYGLEYSSVGSIWSLWNRPVLDITYVDAGETYANLTYSYTAKMPIPGASGAQRVENPLRIEVYDENGLVKTVNVATNTTPGEDNEIRITGLSEATGYEFVLKCGWYDLTVSASDTGSTDWAIEISNFSYGWSGKGELNTIADYRSHTDPVSVEIICQAGASTAWTATVDSSQRTLSSVPAYHDRMFHHDGTYTVVYRLTSPNGAVFDSPAFTVEVPQNDGVRVTDPELDYLDTLRAYADFTIEVPSSVVCGAYEAGIKRYNGTSVDYVEQMEGTGDWATGRRFNEYYEIGGTGLYNRPSSGYVVGGIFRAAGYMEDCFFKRFESSQVSFIVSYAHCYAHTCTSANVDAFNFKYDGDWAPGAVIQIDEDYTFPDPESHTWSWDGVNQNMGYTVFNNLTPSGRYYYRIWNDSGDFPRIFCYPRQVVLMTGGLTMDNGELSANGFTGLFGSCWYSVYNQYCGITKDRVQIHVTGTDGTDIDVPQSAITMKQGLGGEISFSIDTPLTMGAAYRADFTIGTVTCFAQCEVGVIVTAFSNGSVSFATDTPRMGARWSFTSTDPLEIADLTMTYTDENGSHTVSSSDMRIDTEDGGYSGTVYFSPQSGSYVGGTQYTAHVTADGVTAGAQGNAPSNMITVGVDRPTTVTNIITVTVHTPSRIE